MTGGTAPGPVPAWADSTSLVPVLQLDRIAELEGRADGLYGPRPPAAQQASEHFCEDIVEHRILQ